MTRTPAIRILITLPPRLKRHLEDLKRLESRSASGYIQFLLREDRRSRIESGWRPTDGWTYRESPEYQQQYAECVARFNKDFDTRILKAAKRIEKEKSTRPRRVRRTPR